jgi:hypothetical protein
MISEYWADGPSSELPPGHWNLLAQLVARRDHDSLDEQVKLFFLLNNALFDASISVWECKRFYDYVRPITAIRFLFAGQQVEAWGGPFEGPQTIDGGTWLPYQRGTFLTPPFPEYVSGHSTFSAASAEILKRFTGSDAFGYGVALPPGSSRIEPGLTPRDPVVLFWPTFSAAADQAGLSRRYGGIHFRDGDLEGRALGRHVAALVWRKAQRLFAEHQQEDCHDKESVGPSESAKWSHEGSIDGGPGSPATSYAGHLGLGRSRGGPGGAPIRSGGERHAYSYFRRSMRLPHRLTSILRWEPGDAFIVNGKIFPAGTLPSGTASNDPTQPVNGVSSIGDWCCRGQVAGAFPPDIAPAYSSTPFALNTQYFILKDGGALTAEGYTTPTGELLSVTGGIRGFSGASGFIVEAPFGTNATGCPNFSAKFHLRSGRGRD